MTKFGRSALRRAAFLALLAGSAAIPAAPTFAQASAARQFDIPAGPLGSAIARLGGQAGVVISADPALVRGKRTTGFTANLSPSAALDRLIAGSGLRAEPDGRGGYRIVRAVSVRGTAAPEAGAVAGSGEVPETYSQEPIVVVGALTDAAVTAETIELRQANDLADLFRTEPSVAVGGSVGIAQKIYVRGLEDSMLNVTVDGAPQRGTLFHHIGRVGIEPELLETVEIQAGAGEATAGFGAIGGAIRFRTKDATDLLQDGQSLGGIVNAGYFTNEGYKLSGTLFARLTGDLGLLASYVHVERENMQDGGGIELPGTEASQRLGFLKVGGEIGGGHRLTASYEHREEEASFAQRPNWPAIAGNPLYPAEGRRQTAIVNYGFDPGGVFALEATGYWTRSRFLQDVVNRWGLYSAEIDTRGVDVRGRFRFGDHDLVVGGEYRSDQVISEYLAPASQWQDWAWDPAIGRFEEKGSALGFYVQDHWQVADPLLLSFGARYDAYDLDLVTYANGTDSDGFSFNAGAELEIVDGLKLNASFAEAFRGKEIGDAFTLETRPGRITFPADLRPERVDNYEGGISYTRDGFRASAVYYMMTIDDVILDQIGNGPPPQAANYYENVGEFRAEGFELRAGYTHGAFSVDAYYNHYRSKLNDDVIEGYEHIGLGNSVGDNWNLTGAWNPSPDLGFEASVTHYADLDNIEVLRRSVEIGWIDSTQFVDKPGYTVVDLFGRWRPFGNDRLTVLAAVYNLFDEQYRAHASVADYTAIPDYEGVVGVNEPGRNVRLTASVRF